MIRNWNWHCLYQRKDGLLQETQQMHLIKSKKFAIMGSKVLHSQSTPNPSCNLSLTTTYYNAALLWRRCYPQQQLTLRTEPQIYCKRIANMHSIRRIHCEYFTVLFFYDPLHKKGRVNIKRFVAKTMMPETLPIFFVQITTNKTKSTNLKTPLNKCKSQKGKLIHTASSCKFSTQQRFCKKGAQSCGLRNYNQYIPTQYKTSTTSSQWIASQQLQNILHSSSRHLEKHSND